MGFAYLAFCASLFWRRGWSCARWRRALWLLLVLCLATRTTHHDAHLPAASYDQLFGDEYIVFQLPAAAHKIAGFDVRQGNALRTFFEGGIFIHFNLLRLSIRPGNGELGTIGGLNFAADELFAQAFAVAPWPV